MPNSVDDKVVAMSFESSKFESGVNSVINALDKLKNSLKFQDAGKGLDNINASAQKVDLSHIAQGVDEIKSKLGALSVAALAIFANIATHAFQAGAQVIKGFTLQPVLDGFREYETNLNAIQTVLSNTKSAGTTLSDVNKALQNLNTYSDKTIYNFSQMAKNIGTFTAAGVDLKTSTESIKGIANLAALSGSNADQAATAMYQLSQAISAGRVSLQDWNSVVNAGMGGTVFQRALAQTATQMGTLKDGALKLVGPMKNVSINGESFRQSLQAGPGKDSWLTSKVLTATLSQFSGDLSNAQLKAQGFNDAQIKAIQAQAKMAQNAATQVKTFSQLISTTKEAIGSGWTQTWQLIFGDFGEAKTLFTSISNTLNGVISASAQTRNKMLQDWKDLGGRTAVINGIKFAFRDLAAILKPIKEAFRDIFPATTGKQLADLSKRFKDFMLQLRIGPQTAEDLKRTFRGLFAILDIGKQAVGGILHVVGMLFGAVAGGGGSFLNLTGNIGDFLVSVDEALKKGGKLRDFFNRLGTILAAPIAALTEIRTAIFDLFTGFDQKASGGISDSLSGFANSLSPLQKVINGIKSAWDNLMNSFGGSSQVVQNVTDGIVSFFANLGTTIADVIHGVDFGVVFSAINTGLLAGIFVVLKKFTTGGFAKGFGGGVLSNISSSFAALTGSLKALQANIQANTLQKIAISIGLIVASVVALSFIDPKKLNSALSAMTIGFGQLLGAMAILTKISGAAGFVKVPVIAASLVLLAGAVDLIVLAVAGLSRLNWEELAKGLTGVTVLLTGLSVAAGPLSKNSAGMIQAGVGISAIAVALNILARAVKEFGSMSWGDMGKGLAAVAVALSAIGAASRLFPSGMVSIGVGLIAVAGGLKLLASAVKDFGGMDWAVIGKGILAIAGALVIIAGAMQIMPQGMVLQAAALIGISFALQQIAKAVISFGGLSMAEIAKGLGTLAGSLIILAGGLQAMQGSLAGAAALGIAAASIALLTPALESLGKQSWTEIIKSMVALAGALAVLGVASIALEPAAPAMLALGVALLAIGGGLALAGAGIALVGVGLSAIAIAGPTAIDILVKALTELVNTLPTLTEKFVESIVGMVTAIADNAPKLVDDFAKILTALLDGIIKVAPKLVQAMQVLLQSLLSALRTNFPSVVQAGIDMILALLSGVSANIGQIVATVVTMITNFVGAIANNIGKIVNAGLSVLLAVLKGIASGYGRVISTVGDIISKFVGAIASNLGKVATAGLSILAKFLGAITGGISRVVSAGATIITNFVTGIGNNGSKIVAAGTSAIVKFINALASNGVRLAKAGSDAVIRFMNGVADTIRTQEPRMIQAGANIGVAIVQGMINGLGSMAGALIHKAQSLVTGLPGAVKKLLKIHSPSEVFHEIGQFMVLGLANGMTDSDAANKAAVSMGQSLIQEFKDVFEITSPSKVMHEIGQFVGQGFAQGLMGTSDDIRGAFSDLNNKINDALQQARQAKHPNLDMIKKLAAGHVELTKGLSKEKAELISLSNEYSKASDKLKDAQKVLEDAVKTRDDAVNSFASQYAQLPNVDTDKSGQDALAQYEQALVNQTNAVAAYDSTLQQLRTLGLNDSEYQKLLADGTADQKFAETLLAGGKTAVDGLNNLDNQLNQVSLNLANKAANNLYNAGIIAAQQTIQGIIKGTQDKKGLEQLRDEMGKLADEMIKAIKKKLRMKSPSAAFAEIGTFSVQGMVQGLESSTAMLVDASSNLADSAITAMQKSMSDISNVLSNEIDANPTITPVLDLTQLQADASKISDLIATTPVAAVSTGQASSISSSQTMPGSADSTTGPGQPLVSFEQNNYSPKALSEVEIYRQTKNTLSRVRESLNLT